MWEAPQASTGHSPFELVYRYQPRGLLDIVKEGWEQQWVLGAQRLCSAQQIAKNLQRAQIRQKTYYDRRAWECTFEAGDKILVLLPDQNSQLLSRWQGPFEISHQVKLIDYKIIWLRHRQPQQIFYVNLLKKWQDWKGFLMHPFPDSLEFRPPPEKPNLAQGPMLSKQLNAQQQQQLRGLMKEISGKTP